MARMICGDLNNPDGPGLKDNGEPCGNPVCHGTTRCHMHGGKSPAALAKARQQLALLRMPALEYLYTTMEQLGKIVLQFQSDTCAACGYPKGDAEEKAHLIKAAARLAQICTNVLDRTDLGPKATLEVKQSDFDIDLRQLQPGEEQELDQLLAAFDAFKQRLQQRTHFTTFETLPDAPPDPVH